jgi:hypothetical protein
MRFHTSHYRTVVLALALLSPLDACTGWQVQPVTPEELLARETPGQVRVQLADQKHLVLKSPRLVGDSLVGQSGDSAAAVYLPEVSEIAVRRPNTLRTVALVAGIIAVPFAALGITCAATDLCD